MLVFYIWSWCCISSMPGSSVTLVQPLHVCLSGWGRQAITTLKMSHVHPVTMLQYRHACKCIGWEWFRKVNHQPNLNSSKNYFALPLEFKYECFLTIYRFAPIKVRHIYQMSSVQEKVNFDWLYSLLLLTGDSSESLLGKQILLLVVKNALESYKILFSFLFVTSFNLEIEQQLTGHLVPLQFFVNHENDQLVPKYYCS